MKIQAAAKINWYLKVQGIRPDGYHELEMLMQRIALYDDLIVDPSDKLHLAVRSENDAVDLPSDESNLVLRAAKTLRQHTGTKKGARMTLVKRIPMKAGLGGGSADAAAALRALNDMWELRLGLDELMEIGKGIGADVPYCLLNSPAIVEGLGEIVQPVYLGPPLWLVLIMPETGLSTADVFRRYDNMPRKQENWQIDSTQTAIQRGHWANLKKCSGNSLKKPAEMLLNEIALNIDSLYRCGAQFAQMTGAGSAVFGVFTSESRAREAHDKLKEIHSKERCILTQTLA